MAPNKIFCDKKGFKYFIGYKYINKIKPLWIELQKTSEHAKYFEEAKYINFLIEYEKFLERYIKILEKISNLMTKGLVSELVYGE